MYAVYVLRLQRDFADNNTYDVLKVGITKDLDTRINYKGSDEKWPIWKVWKDVDILYCTNYAYDEDTALKVEKSIMDTISIKNNSYHADTGEPRFHNFSETHMISGITEMRRYHQEDADKAVSDLINLESYLENVS
jgi:hypothetical protein